MSATDDAANSGAALAAAIAGPRSVTTDAGTVEAQNLADLIAADKYIAGKAAATRPPYGIRFARLRPPGMVGPRVRTGE
jgi:hypothetical protein